MQSLLTTPWIRGLLVVAAAAVTFPVASATVSRVQQERENKTAHVVDPPLVRPAIAQNATGGTGVGSPAVPAVLIARFDAPGFPATVGWQVASLDGIAGGSTPLDFISEARAERDVAMISEPTMAPPRWSGIVATLLLVGFFVFRRVL